LLTGEKRKKKLQYLQQLVKDGSNDEQNPEPSPQQHQVHIRSHSADYNAGLSPSPFMLPSNSNFAPLSSSGTTALGPAPAANGPSYDDHLLPTTQSYPPFESSWNSQTYNPPPPLSIAYAPAWISSVDYASRLTSRQESFHLSSPAAQGVFEPTTSPYHHPIEILSHAEHFALGSPYGHYNGSHSQAADLPSVSLPNPSSYFQRHYPGPH
jgi:hypothetical protein